MGSSCVWHVMILLSLFLALPSCLLCAEFAKVGMTSGLRAINPLVDQFSLNIYVLQCSPAEVMSVDDLLAHSDFYHNSLPTSTQL